ncbi:MAG: PAS domain S-box protein [Desulforhopalus sp.]
MDRKQQSLEHIELQQANLSKLCLDNATLSFIRADSEGRILYANPHACKTYDYSLEEFVLKYLFDIDPNITRDKWPYLWQTICEESFHASEGVSIRKNGTLFPVEVDVFLFEANGQKTTGAFIRDITERKKAKERALLTQFIYEKVAVPILHGGEDGRILDANEQACAFLGYTKEELCNLTIFDIDEGLSEKQIIQKWKDTQEKEVSIFETQHKHKDGTLLPVEVTSNSLHYEGLKYSISFIKDISARKQKEILKSKANAHLQHVQRLEALGILAGGIAHDFNNILSAILGYTELAKNKLNPGDEIQKYLTPVLDAGKRAKSLVQQILTFSKQAHSRKAPIDISNVVKEALDLIRATIPSSIIIEQDIKTNMGFVIADETMIHQVIMNLCTNASHAMEAHGGTLNVLLTHSEIGQKDVQIFPDLEPGKYAKLVVGDTGHGMDETTKSRVFDPYFTTKKSGEGTGLGLSTVHGIVKEHGGTIKLFSEVNIGTTFQLFFPLEESGPDSSLETIMDMPRGNENILLVDDETFLLNLGKELLEGLGYRVQTRASSIDALEAFRANPDKYDLIFSDLTMPHMTGDVLAREVKSLRPEIPFIICTGYSTKINEEKFKDIGINAVLMKPVTFQEVADAVRKSLDQIL